MGTRGTAFDKTITLLFLMMLFVFCYGEIFIVGNMTDNAKTSFIDVAVDCSHIQKKITSSAVFYNGQIGHSVSFINFPT